jgi:AraC-like DNA-binding protein
MKNIHRALTLESVTHYHQAAGVQPRPRTISAHDEYVEIVTGGRGWVLHSGKWREVQPGDILWNVAGDKTIGRSDPENPYRCLAVRFTTREAKGRGVPRFSFWPDLEALWDLTKLACRLFLDEQFDRNALKDYLEERFLFQVRLHERASRVERYPEPIRAVMNRIEHDFAQPLSIAELAKTAGWSSAYLQEAFRRYVNVSPHQWLLRQRLRAAKERLVSSSDPLKQIAGQCGFADAASLAHTFKAHNGQTPSAYREHYLHFYARKGQGRRGSKM